MRKLSRKSIVSTFSKVSAKGQGMFEYAMVLAFVAVIAVSITSILNGALEYTFLAFIVDRQNKTPELQPVGGQFINPLEGLDPLNQPPVAAVSVNPDPPVVASGETITFTSVSYDPDDGDTIDSHSWDIYGDGSLIKTGQQVTHQYETTDPNAIWAPRLTVTDNHGEVASQSFSVGVFTTEPPNLPPVAVIQVAPASGPAPLTVTFTSISFDPDGTVVRHQWDFGENTQIKDGWTEERTYTEPGEYEAELTITDDGGRKAKSYRVFITVEEPPEPNVPPTASIRSSVTSGLTGASVDFITDSYSDSDGTVEYYEWDFGDGSETVGPHIVSGGIPIVPHTYQAAGDYTASLIITDNSGDSTTVSMSVTITERACNNTTIRRQIWNGVTGSSISNLTSLSSYPHYPDVTETLTSLEEPAGASGDNYGDRYLGYILPAETGPYTFYIASDDQGDFYLSSDDSPSNMSRIAHVSSWVPNQDWTRTSSQKSAVINLVAGQKYYFEMIHKEGGGGDHAAIAWIQPGEVYPPNVISEDYLCFDDSLIPDAPPPTPTPAPTPTPVIQPGDCNYQAEDAILSGPSVKNSHSGYQGSGFADFPGKTGSNVFIEWNVSVPTAGIYNLDFRYALGSGNRPLQLSANGSVLEGSMAFPATGGWGSWDTQSRAAYLNAGNNTVRLTANNNAGANYDCLAVYP